MHAHAIQHAVPERRRERSPRRLRNRGAPSPRAKRADAIRERRRQRFAPTSRPLTFPRPPDPERTKAGLRASYRRLAELEFEHLLLAHGAPFVGAGREALAAFAA